MKLFSIFCKYVRENISITLEFGICKKRGDIIIGDEETQSLLCGYRQCEQNDINEGMNTIF